MAVGLFLFYCCCLQRTGINDRDRIVKNLYVSHISFK